MDTKHQDYHKTIFPNNISPEDRYSDYITFQVIDSACLYIPTYRMLSGDKQSESLWDQLFEKKEMFIQAIKNGRKYDGWMYRLSETMEKCKEDVCKRWVRDIFPNGKPTSNLSTNPLLKSAEKNAADINDFGNEHLLKMILQPLKELQNLLKMEEMPYINLVLGVLYSQMAYPSFPVLNKSLRLQYTAKKRQMFSNVFIFDKCRYLYEQFPSVHFATKEVWQEVVFCIVASGLQKHIRDVYSNMYHKEISNMFKEEISDMFEGVLESADSHYYIPDREVLDFEYFSENGIRLEKEGNLAEAIVCYRACCELCPNATIYTMNKMACTTSSFYQKMVYLDRSLEECEKVLELDPNNLEMVIAQEVLEEFYKTAQKGKKC